jgi:hypothetical protein
MKNWIIVLVAILVLSGGCQNELVGPPAPPQGENLIKNPTFQLFGFPSLWGWTASDSSVVQFSNVIPVGGSGWSILLHIRQGADPGGFYNAIYATAIVPVGTHSYRLSFFGKKQGEMGGDVSVYRNRSGGGNAEMVSLLSIVDTSWATYSSTDTLTTLPGDTVMIMISGGSGEYDGTTYLNTCRFERLN